MTGRSRLAVLAVPAALTVPGVAPVVPADAAVNVRITSLRVVTADTRAPVRPPYTRGRAYSYVVRYRIAGEPLVRVTRRAEIRTPGGNLIARVAPPASVDEPGEYFATSRIPIGRRHPRATYVLTYTVTVRGDSARRRAVRVLRLRFV